MKFYLIALVILITFANQSVAQTQSPTIKTTKITDNLYRFFIYKSQFFSINIYAFVGGDGVLLIDTGFKNLTELVLNELRKITDKKIKYIINTHDNPDHTEGNNELGRGATIIAHQNCRNILARNPKNIIAGLPSITFQDSMMLYFNGEEITLKYLPGHTSSDIIVHFKTSNIVFVGDLVFPESFPMVQLVGSIYSLEKSISTLSCMLNSDAQIMVGHGHEVKESELSIYINMIEQTKQLVIRAIQEGKSLPEAQGDNILKDWISWNNKIFSFPNTYSWIENLYNSLDEGKELLAIHLLKSKYEKDGLNAMIAKYQEIVKSTNQKPLFVEYDFNIWGYNLIKAMKILDAIEVFKINTKMFPKSENAYNSLGEAYILVGNKELAIKAFNKSLELNPQNTYAEEQLKKLKK